MRPILSGFLVVVALTGCATVLTPEGERLRMRSTAFRDYVEGVFREQNRWATELLIAQEEAEGDRYDELVRAEDRLLGACAGLNELAAARRDSRSIGPVRRANLARTAAGCEVITAEVRGVVTRPPAR